MEIVRPAEALAFQEANGVIVGPGSGEGEVPADEGLGAEAGTDEDGDEEGLPEWAGYFPSEALPVPSVTSSTTLAWEAL